MRVLITGASGFIGSALSDALTARGDEVRALGRGQNHDGPTWDIGSGRIEPGALDGIDAVVHLAGASILPPWTSSKKGRILASRVEGTDLIARAAAEAGVPTLISASGMDYYGDRGEDVLSESEPAGDGFMSRVASAWEAAAAPAVEAGLRVAHLRTSLVLDASGGSLPLMMLPFRFFVGGPVGTGRQWWSWTTLADEVRAIVHILDNPIHGPVNLATPNPVRNAEFMAALGRAMRRPSWFRAPGFLVRTVLGADAAEALLLESKRVEPAVLRDTGFSWSYPDIEAGMQHAVIGH